jgi:hypothetical protein
VGTYADIVISVSDGLSVASLPAFDIAVSGGGATGSAFLSWTAPTENTDGSPLTDLAGYLVYYGTELGSYPDSDAIDNPGVTNYVVEDLTPATWFFIVTARDTSFNESEPSNVATKILE